MNFVVDDNVAIKWFVGEELRAEAHELVRRNEKLFTPDFILAEISRALWKKVLGQEINEQQARNVFGRSHSPFSRLYSLDLLNHRTFEIALDLRHHLLNLASES